MDVVDNPIINQLVPLYSKNGYELRYKLKIGTEIISTTPLVFG